MGGACELTVQLQGGKVSRAGALQWGAPPRTRAAATGSPPRARGSARPAAPRGWPPAGSARRSARPPRRPPQAAAAAPPGPPARLPPGAGVRWPVAPARSRAQARFVRRSQPRGQVVRRWGCAHGRVMRRTAGSHTTAVDYDAPAHLWQAGRQHTGLPEARHAGRPARRSRHAAGAGPECARTAAQAASAALRLSGPGARRPRSAEQLRRRQARVRQCRPCKALPGCPRRGPRRMQRPRRSRGCGRQQAHGPKPYRVGARPPRGRYAQLLQRRQVARAQRGGRGRRRPQAARRALRGAHGDALHAPPEVACVERARAQGSMHAVVVS